jgi:hypothetical protein
VKEDWNTATTVGERLRWAIEERPRVGRARGVRLFCKDLEARSTARRAAGGDPIPGVSLPSVMAYLPTAARPASKEPSLDFLREAAWACRVNPAWLAFGEGYPTEAIASAATAAHLAGGAPRIATNTPASDVEARRREHAHRMVSRVLEAVGIPRDGRNQLDWRSPRAHLPFWAGAAGELRQRVWQTHLLGLGPDAAQDDAGDADTWIGEAIRGPLLAFGLHPAQMDARWLGEFISALLPVLMSLDSEMRRQLIDRVALEGPGQVASPPQPRAPSPSHRTARSKRPTKSPPKSRGGKK